MKKIVKKIDTKIQDFEKKYLSNRSELGKEQLLKIESLKKEYFKCEQLDGSGALTRIEKELGALGVQIHNSHLPYIDTVYEPQYNLPIV